MPSYADNGHCETVVFIQRSSKTLHPPAVQPFNSRRFSLLPFRSTTRTTLTLTTQELRALGTAAEQNKGHESILLVKPSVHSFYIKRTTDKHPGLSMGHACVLARFARTRHQEAIMQLPSTYSTYNHRVHTSLIMGDGDLAEGRGPFLDTKNYDVLRPP